jgi:hypothetical protein
MRTVQVDELMFIEAFQRDVDFQDIEPQSAGVPCSRNGRGCLAICRSLVSHLDQRISWHLFMQMLLKKHVA